MRRGSNPLHFLAEFWATNRNHKVVARNQNWPSKSLRVETAQEFHQNAVFAEDFKDLYPFRVLLFLTLLVPSSILDCHHSSRADVGHRKVSQCSFVR